MGLAGIYDGHGDHGPGEKISEILSRGDIKYKNKLTDILQYIVSKINKIEYNDKNMINYLKATIISYDKLLYKYYFNEFIKAGSTLSVCMCYHSYIYSINSGDSKLFLFSIPKNRDLPIQLFYETPEHKPELYSEKKRILENNFEICNDGYICTQNDSYGVNVSRGIGDYYGKN